MFKARIEIICAKLLKIGLNSPEPEGNVLIHQNRSQTHRQKKELS